ncbi:MAG: hypothetical protein GQ533_08030 [Methanosarcinaceae archaeon]|nr:hypothetical protein [Methanosarcinaceae archaeon]
MEEGFWKEDCDLRFVVDEVYDTSSWLPGSKVGEILVYVGLRCGVGLPSAWLGLPTIGGVAISKNMSMGPNRKLFF